MMIVNRGFFIFWINVFFTKKKVSMAANWQGEMVVRMRDVFGHTGLVLACVILLLL